MSESSSCIEKARFLIARSRWEEARRELSREIAENPENGLAHALDALCLVEMEDTVEATRVARRAIGLDPELPIAHFALASAYFIEDRLSEAEDAIVEAIRLDPQDADLFVLLGNINLERRDWQAALAAAEEGLIRDAENAACVNLRAIALRQSNRPDAAGSAIAYALSKDPDNPLTHANQGWHFIELGRYDEAMDHFRESLRLDPLGEWARKGVVEAIKAKNPVYRVLLRFFLWIGKLSGTRAWLVILGLWIGARGLRALAKAYPALTPFILPALILYTIFVYLTWTAAPLFDLLVRLHPFGKYALSKDQIRASNWVGGMLAATVLLALGGWLFKPILLISAVTCGAMVIPVAGTFACQSRRGRRVLGIYTAALGAVAVLSAILLPFNLTLGAIAFGLCIFGIFIFGFVANAYALNS